MCRQNDRCADMRMNNRVEDETQLAHESRLCIAEGCNEHSKRGRRIEREGERGKEGEERVA